MENGTFDDHSKTIKMRSCSSLYSSCLDHTVAHRRLKEVVHTTAGVLIEKGDFLTELDAAVGDGDLGRVMRVV